MRLNRKNVFVAGLAGALVMGIAAFAWACTAQARIIGLSTPSAASGTEITVSGEGAQSGAPVAIYWNEVGATPLAETVADAAGNFSAAITVPEAPADVHYIVAVPSGAQGGRAPFEVTSPGAAGAPALGSERTSDLWNGFSANSGSPAGSEAGGAASSGGGPARGTLGMTLFAIGAIGLVSGVGVAAARRRATARR